MTRRVFALYLTVGVSLSTVMGVLAVLPHVVHRFARRLPAPVVTVAPLTGGMMVAAVLTVAQPTTDETTEWGGAT